MSESIHKMNLLKVIDSRLSSGRINEYAIEQGPDAIQYRISPASSISSTNVNFSNINPNSSQTYMSRTVYVQVQYQINFVGTCPQGQNLLDQWGYDISPRCMFINNSFRSSTITLNSTPFSENTNDNLPAYTRVHFDKLKSYLSQSTSVLDNCQKYSEAVGSNANVLAGVQNVPPGFVAPRGGFQGVQVLSNTPISATILLTGTEPIMVSPLKFNDCNDESPAFVNLNTFQAEFNFDDNLAARLISIADNSTATFSNVTATPIKANIYQTFYTAKLFQEISPITSYPWYKVNTFSRTGTAITGGDSAVMVLDLISLASIPKKIYVYLKPNKNTYNVSQTDTMTRINSVDITFGNRNVMVGTNINSLYSVSKANGVDADFSAWAGSVSGSHPRNFSGCGSILALNPLLNFGLDNQLGTSGSLGPCQLQININYTSLMPSNVSLVYDAFVLCVNDGLATLTPQNCIVQDAVVGPTDLLNSHLIEPSLTTGDIYKYSGGSFWSNISDFWTRNKKYIMPVAKGVSTAAKIAYPELAAPLSMVGLGNSGGGLVGGAYSGGGLVGGAKMSKKKLLQLINK